VSLLVAIVAVFLFLLHLDVDYLSALRRFPCAGASPHKKAATLTRILSMGKEREKKQGSARRWKAV
jgi:hypothetical protein